MSSDVEVQDPATAMLDDEQAVEQLKRHGWHREEIESNDDLAVVLEKSQPSSARVTAAAEPSKIASDGPFGDDEAELLKFSVDLGGSPIPGSLPPTAGSAPGSLR